MSRSIRRRDFLISAAGMAYLCGPSALAFGRQQAASPDPNHLPPTPDVLGYLRSLCSEPQKPALYREPGIRHPASVEGQLFWNCGGRT